MALQNVTVTPEPFTVPVNVTATLAGQATQPAPTSMAQSDNHRLYAVAATVVLLAGIAALFFYTPAPVAVAPPSQATAPAPVAVAPVVVQPVVVTPAPAVAEAAVVAAAPQVVVAPAPQVVVRPRGATVAPRLPAANKINMLAGRPTMLADGTCRLTDGRIGFRSGDLCLVKTN